MKVTFESVAERLQSELAVQNRVCWLVLVGVFNRRKKQIPSWILSTKEKADRLNDMGLFAAANDQYEDALVELRNYSANF